MKKIIKAYSKINVFLNITNKIEKYTKKHYLEGIFLLCEKYYDLIEIEDSTFFDITYFSKDKKKIYFNNDIIKKVYLWLLRKFRYINLKYKIIIHKNIPISSGLGGESSDAAAFLKYIFKINNIYITSELLLDIALNLGSDICFFLSEYKIAYVTEYGNVLRQIRNISIEHQLHIINNIKCETGNIFKIFDLNYFPNEFKLYGFNYLEGILKNKQYDLLENNLTSSAFFYNNKLKIIMNNFINIYKEDKIILSGSGSSIVRLIK